MFREYLETALNFKHSSTASISRFLSDDPIAEGTFGPWMNHNSWIRLLLWRFFGNLKSSGGPSEYSARLRTDNSFTGRKK